jgi:hypothetical protein
MKKSLIYLLLFILFGLLSCNKDTEEPVVPEPFEESIAPDLALKWVELTNYTIKKLS